MTYPTSLVCNNLLDSIVPHQSYTVYTVNMLQLDGGFVCNVACTIFLLELEQLFRDFHIHFGKLIIFIVRICTCNCSMMILHYKEVEEQKTNVGVMRVIAHLPTPPTPHPPH
jgi:hypothetical protein